MFKAKTIPNIQLGKNSLFLLKLFFTLLVCTIGVWKVRTYFSSDQLLTTVNSSLSIRPYLIIWMFVMSFLNWGLETMKWLTVQPIKKQIDFPQAFRSVLIGLGVSLLMPRLAGESIGRYTSHQGNKKDVFSALVLTQIAQGVVTFSFGLLGILYFKSQLLSWFQMPKHTVLVLITVFVILFFFFRKRIIKFISSNAYFESFRKMDLPKVGKLVLFSCLRYFSFFGQFYIMTLFVAVEVNLVSLFFALAILFFVRMATLSINIVMDLGVRFSTALFVFSMLNVIPNPNNVIVILSLVWLFNVILPSLIGGFLILKRR